MNRLRYLARPFSHLAAGMAGAWWALRLEMLGQWGAPPSWWSRALWVGAAASICAAALMIRRAGRVARVLAMTGSSTLAAFFVPACIAACGRLGGAQLGKAIGWEVVVTVSATALVGWSFAGAVRDMSQGV